MTPEEIVERAAEVLVAHQRKDIGSCLCGWGELGRSHPRHQVQALATAGLLPTEAAELRGDGVEVEYRHKCEWARQFGGDFEPGSAMECECEAEVSQDQSRRVTPWEVTS